MSERATSILPPDRPAIITTRLLDAPRDIVWKVLTTPDHLKHFWGPDGFTNTFRNYDLRVGGEARFTMHGPDGKDWPNRFVFLTVEPPRLLRWNHDNGGEGDVDHRFTGELDLYDEKGKTRIELRVIQASMAERDAIVGFAVEGGIQNLERLAAYLLTQALKA
jgi:uncharacterized protein YndB with AHSA1/START domain